MQLEHYNPTAFTNNDSRLIAFAIHATLTGNLPLIKRCIKASYNRQNVRRIVRAQAKKARQDHIVKFVDTINIAPIRYH